MLHIPDERLRKVAEPVKEVNAEIQRIVDDKFDTMYAEEGIGLAATQAVSYTHLDVYKRQVQGAAFATGIPPDLYAFHRYTWNSTPLYKTLACQFRMQFPG